MIRNLIISRPSVCDTEKTTINLGVIDVGQIHLLVQEGFYSNRTDLIRTGIRNRLALHCDALKQTRRAPRAGSGTAALLALRR